jgi:DNA-binding CsgD family transcriptional regulator
MVVTDIAKQKSEHTALAEMNAALRVILEKRLEDKSELEQKVVANVQELLLPLVKKLQKLSNETQKPLLHLLEMNLQEIISPFSRTLFFQHIALSPRELQVANYVKVGMSSKEIADVAGLSPKTVEDHRKAIRKKLGLESKKDNLRSYLLALQE